MTRSKPSRRRAAPAALTPRTVVLAGVGAVSLTRKLALQRIAEATGDAEAIARQAGEAIARVRREADAFARRAQAEFEARFIRGKAARKPRRAAKPAARRRRA